jgi:HPt (histidine-containing phosphotransfer) domain-containing protein
MAEDEAMPSPAHAAIAALWEQFRPLVDTRVRLIENHLLGSGEAELTEVARAAHNLAGALGSYGRPEGSELARRIEHALLAGEATSLAQARDDIARLRAVVDA